LNGAPVLKGSVDGFGLSATMSLLRTDGLKVEMLQKFSEACQRLSTTVRKRSAPLRCGKNIPQERLLRKLVELDASDLQCIRTPCQSYGDLIPRFVCNG